MVVLKIYFYTEGRNHLKREEEQESSQSCVDNLTKCCKNRSTALDAVLGVSACAFAASDLE